MKPFITFIHRPMAPTVSVIIPTYNRSALLPKAIESVLAQTYKDYELIVIDDGSTDDTRERLKPYTERIRYFYQHNGGASAAQNKGIEVARGKWVSVLASDDVWLPTKLARQLETLAALGNEFGACFTDCSYMGDPSGRPSVFEQAGFRTNSEFGQLDNPARYILGTYPAIYFQSLIVLRSLLKEAKGFDDAIGVSEDRDLIFRLTFKTKFCFVSAPLVRIDATPSVSRLTDLLGHKDDQLYAWFEYRCKKWLALPELADRETRQIIQDELIGVYYGWVILKLNELRLADAIEKVNQIRRTGDGYFTIFFTLLVRAIRKLFRALRGRSA